MGGRRCRGGLVTVLLAGLVGGMLVLKVSVALAAGPPPNVPVSNLQPLAYGASSIAVDPAAPGHLAIAYEERTHSAKCFLGLSSDNGKHWRRFLLVGTGGRFPIPGGHPRCIETRVLYTPNGTLYYFFKASTLRSCRSMGGCFSSGQHTVTISKDGGRTFSRLRPVDTTLPPSSQTVPSNDDEPQYTVDRQTGIVYVAFTRYSSNFSQSDVLLGHVRQGSTSFSKPVVVGLKADIPAVAVQGGRIYYTYQTYAGQTAAQALAKDRPPSLNLVTSSNGGQSFGRRKVMLIGSHCLPSTNCYPTDAMAAGPRSGDGYVTWDGNVGGLVNRVFISATHNGGRTWSAPRIIGRVHPRQLSPYIREAPNGRLDVVYYDLTSDNRFENTYLTSSTDHGRHFSSPRRISSTTSDTKIAAPSGFANDAYIGNLVDSSNQGAFMAWTDTRRGNLTNDKNDVYFAKVLFRR